MTYLCRNRWEAEEQSELTRNLGIRMGWVVNTTLRPLHPPGKFRYPLYRRLGRRAGWSRRAREISLPPEFEPRTVQPVASRYTD